MCKDLIKEAMYWADIGDNRIGPLIRELIEVIGETENPHVVKQTARRIRMLSSSFDCIAHQKSFTHDKSKCEICKKGSVI
jgi:hypothetical protein